jgi:uncharacterized protein (UPF0335 family)
MTRHSPEIENKNNFQFTRGPGRPVGSKTKPKPEPVDATSGHAAGQLKSYVERIERLSEEKKALSDDISDVFTELKGQGFDVKAVRQILRIRKQNHSERMELEAILELYMSALGMK